MEIWDWYKLDHLDFVGAVNIDMSNPAGTTMSVSTALLPKALSSGSSEADLPLYDRSDINKIGGSILIKMEKVTTVPGALPSFSLHFLAPFFGDKKIDFFYFF